MITGAAFKKGALSTWSVKPAKKGVREMTRHTTTLNIGHALVGLGTESGELMEVASNYILGLEGLGDIQEALLDELSDVVYYCVVAAKFLKIPLPPIKRKPKSLPPAGECLMEVSSLCTRLLSQYKKVYYGKELDIEKISVLLIQLLDVVWDASWVLLGKPIVEVMQFNNEKLLTGPNARYPQGTFDVAAIDAKESKA